jgi:hypothetical protein
MMIKALQGRAKRGPESEKACPWGLYTA